MTIAKARELKDLPNRRFPLDTEAVSMAARKGTTLVAPVPLAAMT